MNTSDGSAMSPGNRARVDVEQHAATGATLAPKARELLEAHWRSEGYTMPNRATYPWQWLWDSCFHAIVWAELGDDRALIELASLFTHQTPSGFVPHMGYHSDPDAALDFWGRRGGSTITQPPMYGHTIAELTRRGMSPGDDVLEAAERGLVFLLRRRRRTDSGLIQLCHPWESGCDDSPRWDAALGAGWTRESWRVKKHDLLAGIVFDAEGGAIGNDSFAVGSVGFNALVAFNAFELAGVIGSDPLRVAAAELAGVIVDGWDPELRTWVDGGAFRATSGRARTADAHFAILVDPTVGHIDSAASDLVDPAAFGARYGPCGVHRAEVTFDPVTYWRGPAWPQMSYLLWLGLVRSDRAREASLVAGSLRLGAIQSGFAEYWHPDTGQGYGAIPQSWATLALLVGNDPVDG